MPNVIHHGGRRNQTSRSFTPDSEVGCERRGRRARDFGNRVFSRLRQRSAHRATSLSAADQRATSRTLNQAVLPCSQPRHLHHHPIRACPARTRLTVIAQSRSAAASSSSTLRPSGTGTPRHPVRNRAASGSSRGSGASARAVTRAPAAPSRPRSGSNAPSRARPSPAPPSAKRTPCAGPNSIRSKRHPGRDRQHQAGEPAARPQIDARARPPPASAGRVAANPRYAVPTPPPHRAAAIRLSVAFQRSSRSANRCSLGRTGSTRLHLHGDMRQRGELRAAARGSRPAGDPSRSPRTAPRRDGPAQPPDMQVGQPVPIGLDFLPQPFGQLPVRVHIQQDTSGIAHQPVRPACDDAGADDAGQRVHPQPAEASGPATVRRSPAPKRRHPPSHGRSPLACCCPGARRHAACACSSNTSGRRRRHRDAGRR